MCVISWCVWVTLCPWHSNRIYRNITSGKRWFHIYATKWKWHSRLSKNGWFATKPTGLPSIYPKPIIIFLAKFINFITNLLWYFLLFGTLLFNIEYRNNIGSFVLFFNSHHLVFLTILCFITQIWYIRTATIISLKIVFTHISQ